MYHVTCQGFKKAISLEEDSNSEDLQNKILEVFTLEGANIRSIQVFNPDWDDWLDIDERQAPPTRSKILVIVDDDSAQQGGAANMHPIQVAATCRTVEPMQVDQQ